MIGSVFSIPSLLDSVEEETVNDMLQTFPAYLKECSLMKRWRSSLGTVPSSFIKEKCLSHTL